MGKKTEQVNSHIPRRLNIIYIIVFFLFTILVLRLAFIQLVQGEEYLRTSEENSTKVIPIPAPRGWILDKNGEVLVNNKPVYTVTFREDERMNINRNEVAQQLALYLEDKDVEEMIAENDREGIIRELKRYGMTEEDISLDMTIEELGNLLETKKILYAMVSGYRYMPHSIKADLSWREVSLISEHRDELPGVNVVVEPMRQYKRGAFATHLLGYTKPIDVYSKDYYEARGYRVDEKVGVSGLEKSYETQLRGKEGKMEAKINSQAKIIETKVIEAPQRGNDLVLTIDANFQEKVEEILADTVQEVKTRERNPLPEVEEAIAVAMDPKTGAILAMANFPDYDLNIQNSPDFGKLYNQYVKGKESNKAIRGGFPAASTVKPLSVMLGLQENLIDENTEIFDPGWYQVGDMKKKNWKLSGHGRVNPRKALQVSNNTYMYFIAMELANWPASRSEYRQKFSVIDYYFSQFGLGVKTGIDLEEELTGWRSTTKNLGNLADALIGQYNAYTPMQLTQYVSTIANGGYRMRPYLVDEIRRATTLPGEKGEVLFKREPEVLNRVDIDSKYIKLAQEGMRMVTQPGGTAYYTFLGFPVSVAAKTGTAQTGVPGMNNSVIIAYAPFEDPEIALAVVVPNGGGGSDASGLIARRILEAYFGINQPSVNNP
ncbi:penicillin-binding protein [Microaerobacter geothermalis]|uniref:peptidoglycan D,D-transpeptidase FtsI family protein n=1 Tax=Microaerobacter geothermalis TaxID=674972 RepID=UPI001F3B115E|nr:penicillin-binding transpeptidase domain-containing protein [Microaerobacter geothermalis]MCF6092709.1 penicillin-binding protein [Microaerobacter geothermalis]